MKKMYRLLLLTVVVFVAPCISLQPNVRVIGGVSVAAATALVAGRYVAARRGLAAARERLHEALKPLPVLITDGGEVAEHGVDMQSQPDYIIQKARRGVEVAQREFNRADKILKGFIALFGVGVITLGIRHMMAPRSEDAPLPGTVTGEKPATKPTSDNKKPLVVMPLVVDDTKKPDDKSLVVTPPVVTPPVVVPAPVVEDAKKPDDKPPVVIPPVVKPLTAAEQHAAEIAEREVALQAEHTRKMQEDERQRQDDFVKDEEKRRLAAIARAEAEREARLNERKAEQIRAERDTLMQEFLADLDEGKSGKPLNLEPYRQFSYIQEMNALGDRRNLQEIVQRIGAMPAPERRALEQRILAPHGGGKFLSRFRAKDLKADDVEIFRQVLNVVDVGPNAWLVGHHDGSIKPTEKFNNIEVGESQEAFDKSDVLKDFGAQVDLAVLLKSRNIAFSLKTPNGKVLCSSEGIVYDPSAMRYHSRDWSDTRNYENAGTFRHAVIERLNRYEAAKNKLGKYISEGKIAEFKAELAKHPKLDIDCPVVEYQYQPLLLLAVGAHDNDHHREFVTALLERGANPRIIARNNGAISIAKQLAASYHNVRLGPDEQSDKYQEYQAVLEDLRSAILPQASMA